MIINITIDINGEALREKAYRSYTQAKKQTIDRFNKVCVTVDALAGSYCPSPALANLLVLLGKPHTEWPKHSIMCECRKCELSINTYCKRIMSP